MCYICHSSHGHEAGCPFSRDEVAETYYTCEECGEEFVVEETHDHFPETKTCICKDCAGW